MDIAYVLVLVVSCLWTADASAGDRSYFYQKCLRSCVAKTCEKKSALAAFVEKQPFSLWLLQWSCEDECRYECMWTTVEAFQKDGLNIPQFHGKWPFVRVLGIQEPASVIFSILNGLSHALCIVRLFRLVPTSAPMFKVWTFYSLVGVNTWLWSTVFHSRDFDFTEKMDYFCAISLVLSSVFVLCCRVLGTEQWWKPIACFMALLSFFVYHVHYLSTVKFDYGYNMKANITVGILNSIGWLWWARKVRKEQPYVWKAVAVVLSLHILLLLEVYDFPPYRWTLDAHSLWHAGTAPLGFLWSSFEIDDCTFLLQRKQKAAKDVESKVE